MNGIYTLRVTMQLFDQERGDWVENVMQVRTQELQGDMCELCMMGESVVPVMAHTMAMAVLGAERRRVPVQE